MDATARACLPAAVLALAGLLAACTTLNDASKSMASVVTPYRIEIVQGNFVSREQVAMLKPGMPRAQVREILGSPMLSSVFHGDRWDYVFTLRREGVQLPSRRLTVHFRGDALARFEGDEMPSESEFVANLDVRRKAGKIPPLSASEEDLKKFAASAPAAAAPASRPAPAAVAAPSYPPLESSPR